MPTVISVLKEEMSVESLLEQVQEFSITVNEKEDVLLFSPRPGKLFDLLNFLRSKGIGYTTNFDANDEAAVKS